MKLLKTELRRQVCKPGFHTLPHDEDDFINTLGVVEPPPGMSHYRAACDIKKKFVRVWSHASAFAGGNDECGRGVLRSLRIQARQSLF